MLEAEKNQRIEEAEEKIRNKEYSEAITSLLEIVDNDPKFAPAYNYLGIIAWEQSRWNDAFGLFREAVILDNSKEDSVNNLLDSAFRLHKIDEIKPILDKAAADNPENRDFAEISKAINDPENDIYQSIRALTIGYWHPLIEEGDNLIKEGEYLEAARAYLDHLENVGICAGAYNGLGIVQFNAKEYKEAFGLFFEALKLNPLNTDTFLNLFDAAVECGLQETALEAYEILVKQYPHLEEIRHETEILKKK